MDLPQLQPLTFGELLDRAFTYYRRHFLLFFGIMAIPQALIVAGNTLIQAMQARAMMASRSADHANPFAGLHPVHFIVFGILLVIFYFLYAMAMGATALAVSEIHLGRAITVRAAYQRLRGRIWRITDLVFTIFIRMGIAFVLIIVGFGALAAMIGAVAAAAGGIASAIAGIVAFIGVMAGAILAVRYFLGYSFAVCALILENLKAGPAIRRSLSLAKGSLRRVFLIGLLMGLVSWTVAAILQAPFFIAIMILTLKTHETPPFWLNAGSVFASGLGQAATGGLLMVGMVLLYYDIRVRKEGFDLQLMMSALDGQSPEMTTEQNYLVPAEAPISPMNIAAALGLTLLTFGLYIPIWFMQKRAGLNQLHSSRKVRLTLPITALVLSALVTFLNLGVLSHIPWIYNLEIRWDSMANAIAAGVIGFLMVIQAFQVRSILEDHSLAYSPGPLAGSIALVQQSAFSVVGTFFFGIFYLQHKINEMVETWPQTQPTLGSDPVPAA